MTEVAHSIHQQEINNRLGSISLEERRTPTPSRRPRPHRGEKSAQQISDDIDAELEQHRRVINEKLANTTRLLVLGARGSGKTALQTQVKMLYDIEALNTERAAWRNIVHANLLTNLTSLLGFLDKHDPIPPPDDDAPTKPAEKSSSEMSRDDPLVLRQELRDAIEGYAPESSKDIVPRLVTLVQDEVHVRRGWKQKSEVERKSHETRVSSNSRRPTSTASFVPGTLAHFIHMNAANIKALWDHAQVQQLVREHDSVFPYTSGLFLNNVLRVACHNYVPNDDDILKCRCKTMGVDETTVTVSGGTQMTLYDVSGSVVRSPKVTARYFNDVDALIYLFDVSCFDELENKHNRFVTALKEFGALCLDSEFRKLNVLVVLTKVDLLKRKLKNGVKIRDYITYGDPSKRANDPKVALAYFEELVSAKFQAAVVAHCKAESQAARNRQLRVCTANLLDAGDARRAIRDAREIAALKDVVQKLW